jgi:hypothetical protein
MHFDLEDENSFFRRMFTPRFIKDTSENAYYNFFIPQDIKIDVLFIDGDHSYEGVKLDFENIINKNENDIEIQIKKLRIEGKSYSKILELIKNEFKNEKITLYRIKKILNVKNS